MAKLSDPFSATVHKTERTGNQILVEWINGIIKEKQLPLGRAEQETSGTDRKQPDIVIFERPQSQKVLCLLELKPPHFNPFNENELIEPAREKATKRQSPYFCTSNFKELIWFNTQKVNQLKPLQEQIVDKYQLSQIETLDYLSQPSAKNSITRVLEKFLNDLYQVHTGKKITPKHPLDELLVYLLQEKIKALALHYENLIKEEVIDNPEFSKELQQWFVDQNWSFTFQDTDYKKAARQAAYLLVNKILFYSVLQSRRPQDFDPLEIPKSLTKGSLLQSTLQGYFDQVLKVDYETIYDADFIDQIAFPDILDVVEEIKDLIRVLARYNFAKLRFDIIGRIFETLIPAEERHILGQYFTRSDVVDLILRFCLRDEKDKVFDPGCGAGTFLVRAYQHKKIMNQRLSHEEILESLWGNDIAKFPAHLTTINLAINDLSSNENYPRVIKKDFFELLPDKVAYVLPESWRGVKLDGLGKASKKTEHPRFFDCVVGNPPYTRQEEIADLEGKSSAGYKAKLIQSALNDINGEKLADISKRAGLHAYFFVHGFKFLKPKGRFGFIVSNSWLDVDYGKGLQEFFLRNYKIVAIIESKIERWFTEADVNTCIVILEKCVGEKNKKERDENLCRFAYLKRPLADFIPPAHDMWEKQVERLNKADELIKTILGHHDFYENDDLRIFPKRQNALWDEGFDEKENKYVGAKWGKYLKAPEIFFKILERAKDKFVPLKTVADVQRGVTTGANKFFYLTEEQIEKRKIEKEFWMHQDKKGIWVPNYIIRSPRECKSIVVNPKDLKYRVLLIHKDKEKLKGTHVLKYIQWGELQGFHKRPTCASRGKKWYELSEIKDPILSKRFIDITFCYFLNEKDLFIGDTFFAIQPLNKGDTQPLICFLNSTMGIFLTEIYGRTIMGEGVLLIYGPEIKPMPIINPKLILREKTLGKKKAFLEEINSAFDELGTENPNDFVLDNIKPKRRKLDKIIMGDILGLTEKEQLEIYKAVIDLVKSRLERAKSVSRKNKTKEGIDLEKLTQTVMQKIGPKTLGRFYKEKILSQKHYIKKLPPKGEKTKIVQTLMEWLLISDKKNVSCTSEEQARYLKIWLKAGLEEVATPSEENYLKLILPELENLFERIKKVIDSFVYSIVDPKTRQQVSQRLWREVTS